MTAQAPGPASEAFPDQEAFFYERTARLGDKETVQLVERIVTAQRLKQPRLMALALTSWRPDDWRLFRSSEALDTFYTMHVPVKVLAAKSAITLGALSVALSDRPDEYMAVGMLCRCLDEQYRAWTIIHRRVRVRYEPRAAAVRLGFWAGLARTLGPSVVHDVDEYSVVIDFLESLRHRQAVLLQLKASQLFAKGLDPSVLVLASTTPAVSQTRSTSTERTAQRSPVLLEKSQSSHERRPSGPSPPLVLRDSQRAAAAVVPTPKLPPIVDNAASEDDDAEAIETLSSTSSLSVSDTDADVTSSQSFKTDGAPGLPSSGRKAAAVALPLTASTPLPLITPKSQTITSVPALDTTRVAAEAGPATPLSKSEPRSARGRSQSLSGSTSGRGPEFIPVLGGRKQARVSPDLSASSSHSKA